VGEEARLLDDVAYAAAKGDGVFGCSVEAADEDLT
jgi:hypothetical protein